MNNNEQSITELDVPPEGNLRQLIAVNPRLAVPKHLKPEQSPVLKPRLTVIETVYHQEPGSDPTSFTSSFPVLLESGEQPCIRKLKVGEVPHSLDTWLKTVSELVIRNDESTYRNTPGRPSETERANVAKRIIEVSSAGQIIAYVRPGRSCRFEPACFGLLQLRCQQGEAKVTVAAFPT